MIAGRATSAAGVLLSLSVLAGCSGEEATDPQPDPGGSGAPAPGCVEVEQGSATMHLALPAGFAPADPPPPAERSKLLYHRAAESGDHLASVGVSAWDERVPVSDDSDAEVLVYLTNVFTGDVPEAGPVSGATMEGVVRRGGRPQVSFTQAGAGSTGHARRFHAELLTVADERFAVMLMAPSGEEFTELRDEVMPTVGEGACSG